MDVTSRRAPRTLGLQIAPGLSPSKICAELQAQDIVYRWEETTRILWIHPRTPMESARLTTAFDAIMSRALIGGD